MSYSYNNIVVKNITYNGLKVKTWKHDNVVVYNSGNTVTYYIESSTKYTEDVGSGESCLSPKTFTPSKSGYTFIGWREDKTASSSVLTSKVMDDSPITLYAVFSQTITLSYNGNSATSGSTAAQTGTRYYNNGNVVNPSFTLRTNGFAKTGSTFKKWAQGSAGGTQYVVGASITLSQNTVFYAVWATPFTLNLASYPVSLVTTNAKDTYSISNTSSYYELMVKKDGSDEAYVIASTPSIPTQGCNKVRVTYTMSGWCKAYIGNSDLIYNQSDNSTSGTIVFDVGNTYVLTLRSQDATGYFYATLQVTKVEFYYG